MWYRKANAPRSRYNRPLSDIMKDTFFHGTIENFEPPLKGGMYDDIVWTADNPAVAQTYIPATGMKSGFQLDSFYDQDEPYQRFFYPNSTDITLLKQMGYGYPINYELQKNGMIQGYSPKDRWATYGEIRDYIRSLGYDPDEDYWLRSGYEDGVERVYPKDFRRDGRLFVGHPSEPLNIFDTTEYIEADEQNPAYHMHDVFKRVRDKGYHGIKIPDFAQSENWGNVEHTSVGIFPEHVGKLDWDILPVKGFDWGEQIAGVYSTPEWDAFHRQKILEAHESGEYVEPGLLAWAREG